MPVYVQDKASQIIAEMPVVDSTEDKNGASLEIGVEIAKKQRARPCQRHVHQSCLSDGSCALQAEIATQTKFGFYPVIDRVCLMQQQQYAIQQLVAERMNLGLWEALVLCILGH